MGVGARSWTARARAALGEDGISVSCQPCCPEPAPALCSVSWGPRLFVRNREGAPTERHSRLLHTLLPHVSLRSLLWGDTRGSIRPSSPSPAGFRVGLGPGAPSGPEACGRAVFGGRTDIRMAWGRPGGHVLWTRAPRCGHPGLAQRAPDHRPQGQGDCRSRRGSVPSPPTAQADAELPAVGAISGREQLAAW